MARKTAIDDLSRNHKKALDKRLVESNFRGYTELEIWLQGLGYQIGKSSIHRYGQKLEKKHKEMEVRTAFNLTEDEQKLINLFRLMSEEERNRLVLRLFYEHDRK